jgi:hypothetical protein
MDLGNNKRQDNQAGKHDRRANRSHGPTIIVGYILEAKQFMPPLF